MSDRDEARIAEACRVTEYDLFWAEEEAKEFGGKRRDFNLRAASYCIARRIRERVLAALEAEAET